MANYTKQELRKRELAKLFAEIALRPKPQLPVCACGAPAAIEVNRWPSVAFYCASHSSEAGAAFQA